MQTVGHITSFAQSRDYWINGEIY